MAAKSLLGTAVYIGLFNLLVLLLLMRQVMMMIKTENLILIQLLPTF